MSDITIVGAGLAGLLAANMLKQKHKITIKERQTEIPHNHSAVLRFRSPVVGDVLDIPFKKVRVLKGYVPWSNPVADCLAYAAKCGGHARSDRSIVNDGVAVVDRYIAPPDLIARMVQSLQSAPNVRFEFGVFVTEQYLTQNVRPTISTAPMPSMFRLLNYAGDEAFEVVHGYNVRAKLRNVDAYASVYVPDPSRAFNRISITGDELIAEASMPGRIKDEVQAEVIDIAEHCLLDTARSAARLIGVDPGWILNVEIKAQTYSKVLPVSDELRKGFIHWATDNYGVYSLGRFAVWKPGLLLDDLVQDVRLIEKWITASNGYEVKRHRS